MNIAGIQNMYLRSLVEAAEDDDRKRRKTNENEEEERRGRWNEDGTDTAKTDGEDDPNARDDAEGANDRGGEPEDPDAGTETEQGTEDDDGTDTNDDKNNDDAQDDEVKGNGDGEDTENAAGEEDGGEGEGENATEGGGPGGDEEVTGDDLAGDDFSLDPNGDEGPDGGEGEGNESNPDGLPSADDDGSADPDGDSDDAETNLHVNILKLSKLDRATAKETIYHHYMDLLSSIDTLLNIIDTNETVIEPETREKATGDLNRLRSQLRKFIKYKFTIINYEDALSSYMLFIRSINDIVKMIHAGSDPRAKGIRLKEIDANEDGVMAI